MSRPRIGVALGSGSARGWSHIGVLRALLEQGVEPEVVTGTSMGALVGAAYAAGLLDELEAWARKLGWRDTVGFLDIRLAGGLIGGSRLFDALRELLGERPIQDCALSYGAVATDLSSGNEIWLREGSLLDAVRASCALPGLFTPVQRDGRWLVDGGLVNPVPVSLCRAMGADRVIAVDLNSDLLDRYTLAHADEEADAETQGGWPGRLGEMVGRLLKRDAEREEQDIPSLLEVLARSNNIMSVRITRSRMAGEPPDVLLTPRLSRIGLMEFHRAAEAIDAGAAEAHRRSDYLAHL